MQQLDKLLKQIKACTVCSEYLPHDPRPVLSANTEARILIIGQAPGRRVHESGIPWDDPSGERLRDWMGVSNHEFYDSGKIALVPMGFCYPGKGVSGDLPPRPECAPLWHENVLTAMPSIKLTLLLSQHALKYYLPEQRKNTLTETVQSWKEYRPRFIPLPHPSPRNNIWLKKNAWFVEDVLPYVRRRVRKLMREENV